MKLDTYRCDICGTDKKEVNHWWVGCPLGAGMQIVSWGRYDGPDAVHLCGLECASKWTMQMLSKINDSPSLGGGRRSLPKE